MATIAPTKQAEIPEPCAVPEPPTEVTKPGLKAAIPKSTVLKDDSPKLPEAASP